MTHESERSTTNAPEAGSVDVDNLAERFDECWPPLNARGRRVALAAYRVLAMGEPVPDYAIAAVAGLEVGEVTAEMAAWPAVRRNAAGRIVGFWGLALHETDHRFEIGGQTLYTWCAWDSLFLPGLVGERARVRSTSAPTGARVDLVVSPGGIESAPDGLVVSFVDPARMDMGGDRVISSFCRHVRFFSSRGEGERWAAELGEGAFVLGLEEAFELGRRRNALRYGDALQGSDGLVRRHRALRHGAHGLDH